MKDKWLLRRHITLIFPLLFSGPAGRQHQLRQVRQGGPGHGRDPQGARHRVPPCLLRLLRLWEGAGQQRHAIQRRRQQERLLQRRLQYVR